MVAPDPISGAGPEADPVAAASALIDRTRFLCLGEGEGEATLSVRRLVDEVVTRGAGPWLTIEQALDAGDGPLAQRALHALRGSLGTLGALILAESLRGIEQQLKAGDWDAALAARVAAAALYRDSLAALADWLQRHPLPIIDAVPVPTDLLPRLLELLRGHDYAALELCERHRVALRAQLGAAPTEAMDGHLRAFEFAAAAALLEREGPVGV